MLDYHLVAYAPKSPRRWVSGAPRSTNALATQLVGPVVPSARAFDLGYVVAWPSPMLGVSHLGSVLIVAWSGTLPVEVRWDRLQVDPNSDRFEVIAQSGDRAVEASWRSPDGTVRRHVMVRGGELVIDDGNDRVFDDEADTDKTLMVEPGTRLSPRVVTQLLEEAAPDDVAIHDGRRYVRTEDHQIQAKARIVRQSERGVRWVAVDQTGPVNTLLDPLARPIDVRDSGKLAERIVKAWFGFSMAKRSDQPRMDVYTWPNPTPTQNVHPARSQHREH